MSGAGPAEPPWVVGKLGRAECTAILEGSGVPVGSFFVREGSAGLVLSVLCDVGVRHCKVHEGGGKFWIVPERKFDTLVDLIESCHDNEGVLVDGEHWVQLRRSIARNRKGSRVGTVGAMHRCPRCGTGHLDLVSLAACMRECDRIASQEPEGAGVPMLHCFVCGGQFEGTGAFAAHMPACGRASQDGDGATKTTLQFWVCPERRCLKVNPPHTASCRGCGASVALLRDRWVCSQCKCANDGRAENCGGCEWGRSESSGAPVQAGRRAVVRGLMKDRSLRRAVILTQDPGVKEAEEQIRRIEAYCHGNAFRNPDFPIALSSLYVNGCYPENGVIVAHHWRRATDVAPPDPSERGLPLRLITDPSPSVIVQGDLGNCWFLGALSLIAGRRDLLDNVLLSRKLSPSGAYHVRLSTAGEWKTILVDDYLPCRKDGSFAFAWGRGRQLWVSLVEKAAAMVYGSYEALQAGSIGEGLRLLSGAPCETIHLDGGLGLSHTLPHGASAEARTAADEVWSHLVSAHAKGQLIGASSSAAGAGPGGAAGVMPMHAYAVVHVWNPREGVRLMCLQNPTGTVEWKGRWSEGSPEWTDRLRSAAPDRGAAVPGQFWIDSADFCALFATVEICKAGGAWDSVRFEGVFPRNSADNSTCFQIKPVKRTALHVHVLQSEFRGVREADAQLDLGVAVLRVPPGVHVQHGDLVAFSPRRVQPGSYCEVYLDDPTCVYVVLPLSFNQFGVAAERPPFKCDFHSSEPLLIEAVNSPPELIGAAVTQHVVSVGSVHHPFADDKRDKMRVFASDSHFVAENRSKTRSFEIGLALEPSRDFTSSRVTMSCRDSVQPLHRQLLCAVTPVHSRVTTAVQYTFSFNARKQRSAKADDHSPHVAEFDLHAPRAMADAGLGKVSQDRDPYADYWGGGKAADGAFGGGQALSDAEIDSMLFMFLQAASVREK